jgi:hypothetical protein
MLTIIRHGKRPDIHAPVLNISIKNDSLLTPGYLFLTPYGVDLPGPYIFDTSGVCVLPCSNFATALMWSRTLYGAELIALPLIFSMASMFVLIMDQTTSAIIKECKPRDIQGVTIQSWTTPTKKQPLCKAGMGHFQAIYTK